MQETCDQWEPSNLDPTTQDLDYFQVCSCYWINNVFHELEFGANKNNVHLATPGECLHMHQFGSAKRAVDSFKFLVMGSFSNYDL